MVSSLEQLKPLLEISKWILIEYYEGIIPEPPEGFQWDIDYERDVLVAKPNVEAEG